MSKELKPCKNTDKEIWRETEGDFYSPSIHITESGDIGIRVNGYVVVKPIREIHEAIVTRPQSKSKAVSEAEEHLIHGNVFARNYKNPKEFSNQYFPVPETDVIITALIAEIAELENKERGLSHGFYELHAKNKDLHKQVAELKAGVVKICGVQCKGHKNHNCHGCPVMKLKLRKERE